MEAIHRSWMSMNIYIIVVLALWHFPAHHRHLLASSAPTDPNDVMGLKALTIDFPKLFGVNFPMLDGDPCYPGELAWIQCSADPVPRVIALNLGDMQLYRGRPSLPDFSSMDALQTIDLHGNFLSGPIPEFLGTFPKLTYL
ncbi:senescence-induced receptor-like serine/threonine-protein kinase [Andrographis paniculata]|uniref:senescence-induced receptor-like serine/threonine-protein kinase n=1 Tax=Andrographis paniculata TaxID=175694 RepID=UPI0021E7DA45|nr:senescence-induced receptor-like serine/threonine-protein kinase [Andrographis paniculata]